VILLVAGQVHARSTAVVCYNPLHGDLEAVAIVEQDRVDQGVPVTVFATSVDQSGACQHVAAPNVGVARARVVHKASRCVPIPDGLSSRSPLRGQRKVSALVSMSV